MDTRFVKVQRHDTGLPMWVNTATITEVMSLAGGEVVLRFVNGREVTIKGPAEQFIREAHTT